MLAHARHRGEHGMTRQGKPIPRRRLSQHSVGREHMIGGTGPVWSFLSSRIAPDLAVFPGLTVSVGSENEHAEEPGSLQDEAAVIICRHAGISERVQHNTQKTIGRRTLRDKQFGLVPSTVSIPGASRRNLVMFTRKFLRITAQRPTRSRTHVPIRLRPQPRHIEIDAMPM